MQDDDSSDQMGPKDCGQGNLALSSEDDDVDAEEVQVEPKFEANVKEAIE